MAKKVNKPVAKSEDRYTTPKGVGIYPWVFKQDEVQEAYSLLLAVDPENPELEDFKKTVKDFGKDAFNSQFPSDLTWCIRGGADWLSAKKKPPTGKIADVIERSVLIKAKSVYMPTVSIVKGGKLVTVENDFDKKQIYSGMVCAMEGTLAAFDGQYPAVTFWFNQVAKLGAGEKIGGNFDPNKTFGGMYDPDDDSVGAGQSDTEDRSGDLDDEIPF
jgi:hypothetical protein